MEKRNRLTAKRGSLGPRVNGAVAANGTANRRLWLSHSRHGQVVSGEFHVSTRVHTCPIATQGQPLQRVAEVYVNNISHI